MRYPIVAVLALFGSPSLPSTGALHMNDRNFTPFRMTVWLAFICFNAGAFAARQATGLAAHQTMESVVR
jgi:hypothetical protein